MSKKDYILEINKIKSGLNNYHFEIDKSFLDEFPFSPIKQSNTQVQLKLMKREMMMELEFTFTGTAHVACDRCLTEIEYPIKSVFNQLIKKAEVSNFADDEILYLGKNETELDLSQFLYESFILSLPAKISCEDVTGNGTCNSEIISKLSSPFASDDENEQIPEDDPRWLKLKDLFKNN